MFGTVSAAAESRSREGRVRAHGSMSRLRILHLVAAPSDAAPRSSHSSSHANSTLGHDDRVVALVPAFDGSVESDSATARATTRTSGSSRSRARYGAPFRRELDRRPVDLVLAHGGRPFAIAVRARARPARRLATHPALPRGDVEPLRRTVATLCQRRRRRGRPHRRSRTELRRLGFRAPIWKIQNFRASTPFADLDRRRRLQRYAPRWASRRGRR